MSWAIAILLALIAFGIAAAAFRLPRATWASLGAALLFGLAGYTLQASPDIPGAPKALEEEVYEDQWQVLDSRELLVGSRLSSSSRLLITADGFARQGRFETAAEILRGVVEENPQDFEAWVALGNALTEQADGILTQASVYALRQASEIAPQNPAPSYFLGLSLLRQGRMMEASQVWRGALEAIPPLADGADPDDARLFLADRVERLESMLGQAGALPQDDTLTEPQE